MISIFKTFHKPRPAPIKMITCYDYCTAQMIEDSPIDAVLVGDSVAMVVHGFDTTLQATPEMMATHISATARGLKTKPIIGDMPFMSYHKSIKDTLTHVETLARAGAHGVKLEGVDGIEDHITAIIKAGIPVMGHLGMTAQSIHMLGGFRVQGKTEAAANILLSQAKRLEYLGCFAVVLECLPTHLATLISEELEIPTIGIGAGNKTDGQILVWHDIIGLYSDFKPKFAKHFMPGKQHISNAITTYCKEVDEHVFPDSQHSYD